MTKNQNGKNPPTEPCHIVCVCALNFLFFSRSALSLIFVSAVVQTHTLVHCSNNEFCAASFLFTPFVHQTFLLVDQHSESVARARPSRKCENIIYIRISEAWCAFVCMQLNCLLLARFLYGVDVIFIISHFTHTAKKITIFLFPSIFVARESFLFRT